MSAPVSERSTHPGEEIACTRVEVLGQYVTVRARIDGDSRELVVAVDGQIVYRATTVGGA